MEVVEDEDIGLDESHDAPPLDIDKMLNNSVSAPITAMIQEEYLADFDSSGHIKPIRDVIKPNFGVIYSEPADTSRALG